MLDEDQDRFINSAPSRLKILNAAPGCGKTYTVGEYTKKIITDNPNERVALISFTNTACEELSSMLELPYPHFLGTIDSFINKFITFPFGRLIMGNSRDITLVGPPITPKWYVQGKYGRYFTDYTFNEDDIPRYLRKYPIPENTELRSNPDLVTQMKWVGFKEGFITQHDSAYIASKLTKNDDYLYVFRTLGKRFTTLIVDEAQDSSREHENILKKVINLGEINAIFVGDPDQSIFEWNNADPELFLEKVRTWTLFTLGQNHRNSQQLCDFSFNFSQHLAEPTKSLSSARQPPQLIEYTDEASLCDELNKILFDNGTFKSELEKTILIARTSNEVQLLKHLLLSKTGIQKKVVKWSGKEYKEQLILSAGDYKYKGDIFNTYKVLERFLFYLLNKKKSFTHSQLNDCISSYGLLEWRSTIHKLYTCLPDFNEEQYEDWYNKTRNNICEIFSGITIEASKKRGILTQKVKAIQINEDSNPTSKHFQISTIHKAKGHSFDTVIFLTNSSQASILQQKKEILNSRSKELLRIIYVAITRSRKNLFLLIPAGKKSIWESYPTETQQLTLGC